MPVFTRTLATALGLVVLLPTGGCCTIASLLCGPDRSRWVSREYRTPDAALATFLEAIRRDQPVFIHESLSEKAKQRYGLPGVLESTVAWERLKREITGLHLAGNATLSAPIKELDGRIRYDLAVSGRNLTVRLVEQAFWEICFTNEIDGEIEREGRYVDAKTLMRMLVVQQAQEPGLAATIRHSSLPELAPIQVREMRLGYVWKVDEVTGLTDP